MRQYETRTEYMDAIAQAMGLADRNDLADAHRSVLQVEHFARLGPILDMVQTAAGQREELPFDDIEESAVNIVGEVQQVLNAHRGSKVKAVQVLVEELEAVIEGKSHADLS